MYSVLPLRYSLVAFSAVCVCVVRRYCVGVGASEDVHILVGVLQLMYIMLLAGINCWAAIEWLPVQRHWLHDYCRCAARQYVRWAGCLA